MTSSQAIGVTERISMVLSKFLKVITMVTILALAYIHMQMQMIDLAYQGNNRERKIAKLIEENGSVTYKILMLKSANNLGDVMLQNESDMQFADAGDVVRIAASGEFFVDDQTGGATQLAQRTHPILNLLSFGVEAQAKTAE